MVNMFRVKRWAAFILAAWLPGVALAAGFMFGGLWGGVGAFVGAAILVIWIGGLMVSNPFTAMIEGRGLLALKIDSTGIITPFLMGVKSPFVEGNVGGKKFRDAFDREAVFSLTTPRVVEEVAQGDADGGITFTLSEKKLNEGRFALFHYPVLLYNAQLQTIITKDWFADGEKRAFAEHGLLYLNRITEDLTSATRDFGRHVVDLLKPGESIFGNKWFWVIVVGGLVVLAIFFLPPLIEGLQGSMGAGISLPQAPVTPR